jgi:uncharacterized protein (DUF1800 family)
MTSRATLAQIRFGTGLRPGLRLPGREALIERLTGPDRMAQAYGQEDFATRATAAQAYLSELRAARGAEDGAERQAAAHGIMRAARSRQLAISLARGVATEDGLRERLAWFWADHFTTVGQRAVMRGSISAYIDAAIRPHLAGRFGDMLEAVILHPVMILYLDQDSSVGPNSRNGLARGRGLNENLARELLELHTLGVGSGYTQRDVRQMAELLTGVGLARGREMVFRPGNAEPGPEEVLGVRYGGADPASLADLRAALQDLARHPQTARHLSTKLADYFLSDRPDPGLVETMTATYLETGGALAAVMQAMLAHDAAWAPGPGRVKRPFHFVVSGLRALGVVPDRIAQAPYRAINQWANLPMVAMGQRWQGAAGPDGFFDDDPEWIHPQALAARVGWAMSVPSRLRRRLPDPREFVTACLGDTAPDILHWSAARAETRVEGVGIILASPDFMRS